MYRATISEAWWWWWIVFGNGWPMKSVKSYLQPGPKPERFSPSLISDTPRAGFEPAKNTSSGFAERRCAVVITATAQRHKNAIKMMLQQKGWWQEHLMKFGRHITYVTSYLTISDSKYSLLSFSCLSCTVWSSISLSFSLNSSLSISNFALTKSNFFLSVSLCIRSSEVFFFSSSSSSCISFILFSKNWCFSKSSDNAFSAFFFSLSTLNWKWKTM